MIRAQRQLFYFVNETPYASLEEAQKADLVALMDGVFPYPQHQSPIADWLLANKEAIVDTLTTTPRSRLKARKAHGAIRKPRQSRKTAQPEPQAQAA